MRLCHAATDRWRRQMEQRWHRWSRERGVSVVMSASDGRGVHVRKRRDGNVPIAGNVSADTVHPGRRAKLHIHGEREVIAEMGIRNGWRRFHVSEMRQGRRVHASVRRIQRRGRSAAALGHEVNAEDEK